MTPDIAWAAGLFEGEGCISSDGGRPRLALMTTDRDTFIRFLRIVGMGHLGLRKPQTARNKWGYSWHLVGFERAQYVLAMLWFGLGKRRRAKAAQILRAALKVKPRKRYKNPRRFTGTIRHQNLSI